MKLSIWHCKVLYTLTNVELFKIADTAEISIALLTQTAKSDEWPKLRDRYRSLSDSKKEDLEVIELIVGDFRGNTSHVGFVEAVLRKIRNSPIEQKTKESAKQQFVSRLSEFGMNKDDAQRFLNQIEHDLNNAPSEVEKVSQVIQETEISIQEKIDIINAGYRFLVSSQSATAANLHDDLREHIGFFSDMMKQLRKQMPESLSFEELATLQRYISYGATSYHKLASLQYELSGVKAHVNTQSNLSKLFGAGYMIVRRDEMGRLVGDVEN